MDSCSPTNPSACSQVPYVDVELRTRSYPHHLAVVVARAILMDSPVRSLKPSKLNRLARKVQRRLPRIVRVSAGVWGFYCFPRYHATIT